MSGSAGAPGVSPTEGPVTAESAVRRVPVPDLCALWAETRQAPMNIALVGVLDRATPAGPGCVDASTVVASLRAAVEANLHRAPMLRRVLHETKLIEGTPVWVDDPALDLTRHVVLARPDDVALLDEESFFAWCAGRSAMPLERSRPLWRMDVVPGLPGGRVGVLLVLHHVVADGVRGVALISSLLDRVPGQAGGTVPEWQPEPPPTRADLVRDNLGRRVAAVRRVRPSSLRRSVHALRALAREQGGAAPVTFLGGVIRPGRRLVVLRFSLEELRESTHQLGCTINELLLAGVTAGLRDVLVERGECRDGLVLRASVPVGAQHGREGGMFMAPLPVGIADAEARLRMIMQATRPRKERADQGVAGIVTMPASVARLGVRWARHAATRHINLYVTNVPGPPGPLYLAGARLLDVVPIAPLVAGVRLSVTALSYDGQFVVSLLADDALDGVPALAAGLQATLSGVAGGPAPTHPRFEVEVEG
jgi:diacylglycerol O-acyltransferase